MKKIFSVSLILICLLANSLVSYARPERIGLKKPDKINKENLAKTQLTKMDLADIEDPAARKAIEQILNYLGLTSKK